MGMDEIREAADAEKLRHGPCTRYRLTLVEEILDETGGAAHGQWLEREMVSIQGGDRHIAGVCSAIIEELTEDYEADKVRPRIKTSTISFTQTTG